MNHDQNQKKGFSGLSTLLSEIDSDLEVNTNSNSDNSHGRSKKNADENETTPHSLQISQSDVTPQKLTANLTTTPREPAAVPSSTTPTPTKTITLKPESNSWKIIAGVAISIAAILSIEKVYDYTNTLNRNSQTISQNGASSTSRSTQNNSASQNRQQSEARKVVIASIAANIRERPDVKSKIISSHKKGERLLYAGATDNFTNIRLLDGRSGYIVSELVIPESDFTRLEALTADRYTDLPENKNRLNNFIDSIQPYEAKIEAALHRVVQRDTGIHLAIHEIEKYSPATMPIDESAGIWYANLARADNSYKNLEDARLNSFASIMGNPLNPDYYVAWGLTNHSLGKGEALSLAAYALLALSPRTTNTWMIVGLAEAMSNRQNHNDTLATGAFILAIKFSRNQVTTRKFYKDLISTSNNPRVQRLIRDALIEEAANPTLFAE